MAFPQYLAMTGAEYENAPILQSRLGWMALHFSAYGTGLSNFPPHLPENAMLLVNDRTPISGHDPDLIASQLSQVTKEQKSASVLLDFQRPNCPETRTVVDAILHTLTCPVGVSAAYAEGFSCPVFLPPVPLHISIEAHLAPWHDREIWLEASKEGEEILITSAGAQVNQIPPFEIPMNAHTDAGLYCHYITKVTDRYIRFLLFRTLADQKSLETAARYLHVTKTVGLYQEFFDTIL